MRKHLLASLALVAVLGHPAVAQADEEARAANLALGAQLADAVTTRMNLRQPCLTETDPLARPFIHSDVGAVLAAVGVNLLLRRVFRHNPAALRSLALGEGGLAVKNAALGIRTEASVRERRATCH